MAESSPGSDECCSVGTAQHDMRPQWYEFPTRSSRAQRFPDPRAHTSRGPSASRTLPGSKIPPSRHVAEYAFACLSWGTLYYALCTLSSPLVLKQDRIPAINTIHSGIKGGRTSSKCSVVFIQPFAKTENSEPSTSKLTNGTGNRARSAEWDR